MNGFLNPESLEITVANLWIHQIYLTLNQIEGNLWKGSYTKWSIVNWFIKMKNRIDIAINMGGNRKQLFPVQLKEQNSADQFRRQRFKGKVAEDYYFLR